MMQRWIEFTCEVCQESDWFIGNNWMEAKKYFRRIGNIVTKKESLCADCLEKYKSKN